MRSSTSPWRPPRRASTQCSPSCRSTRRSATPAPSRRLGPRRRRPRRSSRPGLALQSSPRARAALVDAGVGEYVAIKPAGWNAVYAMGWSPSKAAPKATARLIKAEYLFSPYKPGNAILTSGNLSFSSSVTVDVVVGAGRQGERAHERQGVNGTGLLADGQRHRHLKRRVRRLRQRGGHRFRWRLPDRGRARDQHALRVRQVRLVLRGHLVVRPVRRREGQAARHDAVLGHPAGRCLGRRHLPRVVLSHRHPALLRRCGRWGRPHGGLASTTPTAPTPR